MSFPTDDAHRQSFSHQGITHDVFVAGQGPGVLIMHELPGMTPECLRLAHIVMTAGYRVYLPLLFGTPGQDPSKVAIAFLAARLCLRREFRCLATDENSPITPWLRALSRKVYDDTSTFGTGIGMIGMCLTGNVVLSLMVDEHVMAPVMCQPGLPLEAEWLPGSAARRVATGVSAADLTRAAERAITTPLLAYRFATDLVCRAERFDAIAARMPKGFLQRTIPTGPGNPGNIPNGAHSVLTEAFVDDPRHPTRQALDEILARFATSLRRPGR